MGVKIKKVFLGILTMLVFFGANYTKATGFEICEGIYKLESKVKEGMCLDVAGGTDNQYGNIQICQSNSKDSQKFYIHKKSNGYYVITCLCSGKAIKAGGNKPGSNVYQFRKDYSKQEEWEFKLNSDGYFEIICRANGLNLDVCKGLNQNRTNVQVWEANGSAAQKFRLITLKRFENKGYTVSTDKQRLLNQHKVKLKKLLSCLTNSRGWDYSKIERVVQNSSACYSLYEDKSGELVGFARVITDNETACLVMGLVIDDEHRGKGLGTLLMEKILEDQRASKCRVSLIPLNDRIAGWYKRNLGFEVAKFKYMILDKN